MSSIFPIRDTVTRDEAQEPRLVDLDEETADEVFEALSSQTTRQIFLALHEQPQTASDLADETGTSVQNVQYHLEKLTDADLVEVADTWYSERGSEMKVYAPEDESLVLYAGRDKQSTFKSLLKRFTGVFSLLVPGSLLASWLVRQSDSGGSDAADGAAGAEELNTTGGEQFDVATESSREYVSTDAALDAEQAADDNGGFVSADNRTEMAQENGTESQVTLSDADFLPDADIILPENATSEPILITDGGNAITVSNSTLESAPEATNQAAGIDPALAAGVAFILGGLLVAVALVAYYGLPE